MVRHIKVVADWKGLTCRGTIVVGDTEGDSSIPYGTRELDPYIEDVIVETCEGEDIYDYLDVAGQQIVIELLKEQAKEDLQ